MEEETKEGASMHKTEKPRLAFIGDSITEGWGLNDWEKERYTTLLAQAFPQYEILNFGSSGATLQSQFDMAYTNTLAFEKSIQEQPYDMLFVFLGANDVWYWTSENTFRAEYEQLLARYTASRIFLIAPLKMNAGHYETHKLEQIRAIIKDIARQNGLAFIDLYEASRTDWLSFDSVHPNAYGQKEIARVIAQALRSKDIAPL